MKELLTTTPVLGYPDFRPDSEKMILDCDWSQDMATIGAVLSQPQLHDGKLCERVLAYSSKKLTKAQANYTSFKAHRPFTHAPKN